MKNIFSKLFQHKPYKGIMGAIIGDIVGVPYEFNACKTTEFKLFQSSSRYSDDSVMTIAVAEWLLTGENLPDVMRKWGEREPWVGYGTRFIKWLILGTEEDKRPYNSYGNGSGMRVSPCGFIAESLDEALGLAKQSAEVSHNHPEGIKGAQAIASAIFLARSGRHKKEIKRYIENTFDYDLSRTCDDIRPTYCFNECCQTSCPEAIIAFLDSHDYESAVRLAVSLGGDADTLACMAGAIAAAYYGVPQCILKEGRKRLTKEMLEVVDKFDELTNSKELVMDKELDEYIKEFYNEVSTLTAVYRCDKSYFVDKYKELKIGKKYKITHISVLRSSTNIMLSGFGYNDYNSVYFDIYENGKIIEYTQDPRFWAPYLRDMYLGSKSEISDDEKE